VWRDDQLPVPEIPAALIAGFSRDLRAGSIPEIRRHDSICPPPITLDAIFLLTKMVDILLLPWVMWTPKEACSSASGAEGVAYFWGIDEWICAQLLRRHLSAAVTAI